MYLRLSNLWEKLRSSYWFIPTVLALGAVLLSTGSIYLDETYEPEWLWQIGWFHRNQPDGARELLAVVAGSMITVTGVVFSITIVALSLASQQFGPRLLYNFMRDRGNQVVFGALIATFLYCILVLRTTEGTHGIGDKGAFDCKTRLSPGRLPGVGSCACQCLATGAGGEIGGEWPDTTILCGGQQAHPGAGYRVSHR